MNIQANLYQNESAVILGCGPSISDYSTSDLEGFCFGQVVLSVKQSISKIPNLSEKVIHLYNGSHLPELPYTYKHRPSLIIASECTKNLWKFKEYDYDVFCSVGEYYGIQNTVCGNLNPNDFQFPQMNRPCGPGIMFETVLFLLPYLGITNAYTIGWDGYPINNHKHKHFYSDKTISNDIYVPAHNHAAIEGSRKMFHWLQSKGCNLSIVGNSYMSKDIPRVSI